MRKGKVRRIRLGKFEIESGEVVVSDPCRKDIAHPKGFSIQGILKKVKRGTWTAEVIKADTDWGTRCAELRAFHATHVGGDDCAWKRQRFKVGVDSGQAGIFDKRYFGNDSIIPSNYKWREGPFIPEEPWYSLCCDQTFSDPRAGVIPYGAVSSSGFGDSSYDCFVCRDEDGQVTAVKIIFIPKEEIEG